VSFASGWHAVDFAIRPENYACRKDALAATIETVRSLWRNEPVSVRDGAGCEVSVRTYPTPMQSEIPVWLTSAGSGETFRTAGRLGLGVLTHLAGRGLDELVPKIAAYRAALAATHPGRPGHVVLMLHTFLGANRDDVRDLVRQPFREYLRSSLGLITRASGEVRSDMDLDSLSPDDVEYLLDRSFEKYFEIGGLFGTVDNALPLLERARAVGVDEIACLIDFIGDAQTVLAGLEFIDRLRAASQGRQR
jgi:natural product biosynthesis luciferase-like monooxygenase protein